MTKTRITHSNKNLILRQKSCVGLQVYITTTDDHADTRPFFHRQNALQKCRGAEAARWFDDDIHAFGKEAHRPDQHGTVS